MSTRPENFSENFGNQKTKKVLRTEANHEFYSILLKQVAAI